MNKTYFRIRCFIAWVTGILCFLAFFSAFYPVKIFDLQLTALLQRFLVDVSLTAAILLSALLLLTLFFGRVYCSTLCPFGLLQEFLMLFFRRRTGYRQNRPAKYYLAAVFFGMLLGGTVAVFFIKIGLCVQRVFFLCDLLQPCIALHDGIKNGLVFVSKVVLFQNGHSVFGGKRDLALTGL